MHGIPVAAVAPASNAASTVAGTNGAPALAGQARGPVLSSFDQLLDQALAGVGGEKKATASTAGLSATVLAAPSASHGGTPNSPSQLSDKSTRDGSHRSTSLDEATALQQILSAMAALLQASSAKSPVADDQASSAKPDAAVSFAVDRAPAAQYLQSLLAQLTASTKGSISSVVNHSSDPSSSSGASTQSDPSLSAASSSLQSLQTLIDDLAGSAQLPNAAGASVPAPATPSSSPINPPILDQLRTLLVGHALNATAPATVGPAAVADLLRGGAAAAQNAVSPVTATDAASTKDVSPSPAVVLSVAAVPSSQTSEHSVTSAIALPTELGRSADIAVASTTDLSGAQSAQTAGTPTSPSSASSAATNPPTNHDAVAAPNPMLTVNATTAPVSRVPSPMPIAAPSMPNLEASSSSTRLASVAAPRPATDSGLDGASLVATAGVPRADAAIGLTATVPPAAPGVTPSPLIEQIVGNAQVMLTQGKSEMRMQLTPASLGRLDVHVSVDSGVVTVHLGAESADVRGLLQANLSQLKSAFADRGMGADRFVVVVNQGFSGNDQLSHHDREGEAGSSGRRRRSGSINAVSTRGMPSVSSRVDAGGVDYRA